ncbi:MAG TPA: hypothetical protein VJY35_16555 [Candidatus Eisenbacteria bacterium]|nr:hypothetical protein [Candidatus Eisenbacteria bacterium]
MGFTHTISRERKLARLVGTGTLDFDMCIRGLRALADDLRGETGYGILVDVRESDYLATTGEIRRYAEMVSQPGSLRGHRFAIVVPNAVRFGNARMFSTYLELQGGEADVFRDEASAMEWLTTSGKPSAGHDARGK